MGILRRLNFHLSASLQLRSNDSGSAGAIVGHHLSTAFDGNSNTPPPALTILPGLRLRYRTPHQRNSLITYFNFLTNNTGWAFLARGSEISDWHCIRYPGALYNQCRFPRGIPLTDHLSTFGLPTCIADSGTHGCDADSGLCRRFCSDLPNILNCFHGQCCLCDSALGLDVGHQTAVLASGLSTGQTGSDHCPLCPLDHDNLGQDLIKQDQPQPQEWCRDTQVKIS